MLFIIGHMQIQSVTLTAREGVFILNNSGQEDVCIGKGSSNNV